MRCLFICSMAGLMTYSQASLANEILEEIRVTSHPLSEQGLAQSSTVLSGDELAKKVQGSLGDTLAGEAGVRSASFGAAVGRPVIHGLGGARVKTTEDRIDSLDVSVTSGDHAVTIEPFIANQITVLKGASTLLYGSNAIGGVVDVETGRIPKQLPPQDLSGRIELRAADNANAKTAALRLDGKWSDNFAWHADAFVRDADPYSIPSLAESAALRASEGEEHDEDEPTDDKLVGSQAKNKGGAFGTSYVSERGFVGVSIGVLDAEYGLVGGHEEEGGDEPEPSQVEVDLMDSGIVDLEQTRIDIEAELNNPFTGFEAINFRLGVNDYQHQEIEASGEVGTVFNNDAWESRIELAHEPIGGFVGSVGVQLNQRDFSAIGEEAFVQPVKSESAGIFWVGERKFTGFDLEAGLRFEELEHKPSEPDFTKQKFSVHSASLGIVAPVREHFTMSALLDLTSRAPSIEELYSNGPHLATQSFEIGNPELTEESATGISLTARYETRMFELSSTFYHLSFDDFIYQSALGEQNEGLPSFLYRQQDASFAGVDIKTELHLGTVAGGDLDLSLLFDLVDAKLKGNGAEDRDLPRIPANRYGIGFEWNNLVWSIQADISHLAAQDDTAAFEFASDSYNDLNFYISRKIDRANSDLELFLHGRNLGDDEQRHHVSFVKDLAPAPGRRFELGIRWRF